MTNILEAIKDDVKTIDTYLHIFGNKKAMPAEKYLSTWEENKSRYLWDIFGHKVMLEEPIVYRRSNAEMLDTFNDKIKYEEFYSDFIEFLSDILIYVLLKEKDIRGAHLLHKNYPNNENEVNFILCVRNMFWNYDGDMTCNASSHEMRVLPSENNLLKKKLILSKGEKPFHFARNIIKKLEPICSETYPEFFDSEYWRILNENFESSRLCCSRWLNDAMIKGTLVLSIHPLDYLTMSDNDYGWDSCMTWTRDDEPGEYRCGVLEMMNSPSVVIAYIKGEHQYSIPYIPNAYWSNKKWRELFIVDRDFIAGICGYPFQNSNIEKIVLNKLATLCENHGWPAYSREICSNEGESFEDNGVKKHFITDFMYNDTCYHGTRMLKSSGPIYELKEGERSFYNYSGPARCLICGGPIDHVSRPVCKECKNIVLCNSCGDEIDLNSDAYSQDNDGDCFCEECSAICPSCESLVPECSLVYFTAIFNNEDNDELKLCGCPSCIESIKPYLISQTIHRISPWFAGKSCRLVTSENTPRDLLIPFLRGEGYSDDYQDVPLAEVPAELIRTIS